MNLNLKRSKKQSVFWKPEENNRWYSSYDPRTVTKYGISSFKRKRKAPQGGQQHHHNFKPNFLYPSNLDHLPPALLERGITSSAFCAFWLVPKESGSNQTINFNQRLLPWNKQELHHFHIWHQAKRRQEGVVWLWSKMYVLYAFFQ